MPSSRPESRTSASSPVLSKTSSTRLNEPMAADLSWNPDENFAEENLRKNLFGSIILHAAVAAGVVALAFFHNRGHNWGENAAAAGAIQATMVSSLPLPPTHR